MQGGRTPILRSSQERQGNAAITSGLLSQWFHTAQVYFVLEICIHVGWRALSMVVMDLEWWRLYGDMITEAGKGRYSVAPTGS